jgi:hypothetical protein
MLVALIIAFWVLGLLLAVGLCAAARRGDAQLRLVSAGRQAASARPEHARVDRVEVEPRQDTLAGLGGDAESERVPSLAAARARRSQAGADLALQSG